MIEKLIEVIYIIRKPMQLKNHFLQVGISIINKSAAKVQTQIVPSDLKEDSICFSQFQKTFIQGNTWDMSF